MLEKLLLSLIGMIHILLISSVKQKIKDQRSLSCSFSQTIVSYIPRNLQINFLMNSRYNSITRTIRDRAVGHASPVPANEPSPRKSGTRISL